MKNLLAILIVLIVAQTGFGQTNILFKTLQLEKHEFLMHSKTAECEMTFDAPKIYGCIEEIKNDKLKKIIRWAEKCNCNTIYMDYEGLESKESYKKGVFFFYAICTIETAEEN